MGHVWRFSWGGQAMIPNTLLALIDKLAAAWILQAALDSLR